MTRLDGDTLGLPDWLPRRCRACNRFAPATDFSIFSGSYRSNDARAGAFRAHFGMGGPNTLFDPGLSDTVRRFLIDLHQDPPPENCFDLRPARSHRLVSRQASRGHHSAASTFIPA